MFSNFCFNNTAPTEIYTYGHTLSLLDALPIFVSSVRQFRRLRQIDDFQKRVGGGFQKNQLGIGLYRPLDVGKVGGIDVSKLRSEEHTSELQSLMRISYAVFCLNTYL